MAAMKKAVISFFMCFARSIMGRTAISDPFMTISLYISGRNVGMYRLE